MQNPFSFHSPAGSNTSSLPYSSVTTQLTGHLLQSSLKSLQECFALSTPPTCHMGHVLITFILKPYDLVPSDYLTRTHKRHLNPTPHLQGARSRTPFLIFKPLSAEKSGARAYLPILWSHCHDWPLGRMSCNLGVGQPDSSVGDGNRAPQASVSQNLSEDPLWTPLPFLRTRGRNGDLPGPVNHRVPLAGRGARSRSRSVSRFRQRLVALGVAAAAYAVSMGTEDGAAR